MPYLKFRHIVIFFILLVTLILWKCTSCTDSESVSPVAAETRHNPTAYELGCEKARNLIEKCKTTDEVRRELLDINAIHTNIAHRIGKDAAERYMEGIRETLKQAGDTLANDLF